MSKVLEDVEPSGIVVTSVFPAPHVADFHALSFTGTTTTNEFLKAVENSYEKYTQYLRGKGRMPISKLNSISYSSFFPTEIDESLSDGDLVSVRSDRQLSGENSPANQVSAVNGDIVIEYRIQQTFNRFIFRGRDKAYETLSLRLSDSAKSGKLDSLIQREAEKTNAKTLYNITTVSLITSGHKFNDSGTGISLTSIIAVSVTAFLLLLLFGGFYYFRKVFYGWGLLGIINGLPVPAYAEYFTPSPEENENSGQSSKNEDDTPWASAVLQQGDVAAGNFDYEVFDIELVTIQNNPNSHSYF